MTSKGHVRTYRVRVYFNELSDDQYFIEPLKLNQNKELRKITLTR